MHESTFFVQFSGIPQTFLTRCCIFCRGGAGNKIDQSLFQQICGCLEGKDDIKLYFFTEKEAG